MPNTTIQHRATTQCHNSKYAGWPSKAVSLSSRRRNNRENTTINFIPYMKNIHNSVFPFKQIYPKSTLSVPLKNPILLTGLGCLLLSVMQSAAATQHAITEFTPDYNDNNNYGLSHRSYSGGPSPNVPTEWTLPCSTSSRVCEVAPHSRVFEIKDKEITATLFKALIDWDIESENNNVKLFPTVFVVPKKPGNVRILRSMAGNDAGKGYDILDFYRGHCLFVFKNNFNTIRTRKLLIPAENVPNSVRSQYGSQRHWLYGMDKNSEQESVLTHSINGGYDVYMQYDIEQRSSYSRLFGVSNTRTDNVDSTDCIRTAPHTFTSATLALEKSLAEQIHLNELPVNQRPSELEGAISYQPQGTFVHHNYFNGVNTEIYVSFEYQGINYVVTEISPDHFVSKQISRLEQVKEQKRIYFDELDMELYFGTNMSEEHGVEYTFGPRGHDFVQILGNNYRFSKNDDGSYSIGVRTLNDDTKVVPVYMELIQSTWHLKSHNEQSVFSSVDMEYLKTIHQPMSNIHTYKKTETLNVEYYKQGELFDVINIDDVTKYPLYTCVQIGGVIAPVRKNVIPEHGVSLEVYDPNSPIKPGKPLEWLSGRWIFERPTTFLCDEGTNDLIKSIVGRKDVNAHILSTPDDKGLHWDAHDNGYLKYEGRYIQLKKYNSNLFRVIDSVDSIFLTHKDGRITLDSSFREDSCDEETSLHDRLSRQIGRPKPKLLPYDKNCVAFTLSKLLRRPVIGVVDRLLEQQLINTPQDLQNNRVVIKIINKLNLDAVAGNMIYSSVRRTMQSMPNGRYFAINSGVSNFGDNVAAHAFTIIVNNGNVGVAGNNAEGRNSPYNSVLRDMDTISVWGPVAENNILAEAGSH